MKKLLLLATISTIIFATLSVAHAGDVTVQLQIPIPGLGQSIPVCSSPNGTELECTGVAQYIAHLYRWLLGIAAVLAVLAFTWSGVRWLTSAGESGGVQDAKKLMINSAIGLAIAFCSYALLWAINPELVQFNPIRLTNIEHVPLADDGEPGKPSSYAKIALIPGSCDFTAFVNYHTLSAALFGGPVYAAASSVCVRTEPSLKKLGLKKAAQPGCPDGRGMPAMLWDLKNGGVEEGIKKAADALAQAYPTITKEGHTSSFISDDYEGLIGMWASHEMQFNPYGSTCGENNSAPLNQDCDWGDGKHYHVGLGVHTKQIDYLKEAFQNVYHGTDTFLIKSIAQSVINGSGKNGHVYFCTKDYDPDPNKYYIAHDGPHRGEKIYYCRNRKKFIDESDFNAITSLDDLIQKAKDGNRMSRREMVILMRDPALGAYLIGRHLTNDFDPSTLGDTMTGWGSTYLKGEMADLFAGYYAMTRGQLQDPATQCHKEPT